MADAFGAGFVVADRAEHLTRANRKGAVIQLEGACSAVKTTCCALTTSQHYAKRGMGMELDRLLEPDRTAQ